MTRMLIRTCLLAMLLASAAEARPLVTKLHADKDCPVELVSASVEDLGTAMRYRATFRNAGKTPLRRLALRWDGWSDTTLLYPEPTQVEAALDPGGQDDHEWIVFRRREGVTGYRVRVVRAEHDGAEAWVAAPPPPAP